MLSQLGIGFLLFVGYTYAGYPLLITAWARARPRPLRPQLGFAPSVSVCIAVHNGADFLREKVASLQALDYPAEQLEILLCSDGSSDETESIARELAAQDPRIRLWASPVRKGKPSALNELVAAARGEVLLMTDVRQPLSRGALRALLEPLSDPGIGCVSGNLVLLGDAGASAYWRYEKLIRSAEAQLGAMVGVSGSIYAMRREDYGELPVDVLLDDMYVPLALVQKRKRIVMSEAAQAFDRACADEQEFSRKARTLAGNFQLVHKLPWLLFPFRNPLWFQLWSHKLARLLCPFALLGLLFTANALAWGHFLSGAELELWQALALAQWAFYALALLGERAGGLGALARTFVVLNAAAVVGLWRYLRRSQQVAW
jgi:cellulose synthase/poly-beta-1,6-N-acetylglucosamine synthase-like glycosyltransferase